MRYKYSVKGKRMSCFWVHKWKYAEHNSPAVGLYALSRKCDKCGLIQAKSTLVIPNGGGMGSALLGREWFDQPHLMEKNKFDARFVPQSGDKEG